MTKKMNMKRINIYIRPETKEAFERHSEISGAPTAELIRRALEDCLKQGRLAKLTRGK